MMSTVWGSDVEIFCMAIWLKTDVFVYINNTWDKFSFKGFNPKVGRNNPSDQAIYLGNEASHYEPIMRKDVKVDSIIIINIHSMYVLQSKCGFSSSAHGLV